MAGRGGTAGGPKPRKDTGSDLPLPPKQPPMADDGYARPGDVQSRSMRGAEARAEAQNAVDAGPTPAQIAAATPPPAVPPAPRGAQAATLPPRTATTVAKPHHAPRHSAPRQAAPAARPMSDADKLNDISLSLIRRGPMTGAPAAGDAAAQNISKAMGYAKGGLVMGAGKAVVHHDRSTNPGWFGPGKPGGFNSQYSKRGK